MYYINALFALSAVHLLLNAVFFDGLDQWFSNRSFKHP